jgi:hypothetical protein
MAEGSSFLKESGLSSPLCGQECPRSFLCSHTGQTFRFNPQNL